MVVQAATLQVHSTLSSSESRDAIEKFNANFINRSTHFNSYSQIMKARDLVLLYSFRGATFT